MTQGAIGTTTSDVVVVGGGLAGLVAATTAATAGATVQLFDARATGGRARSAERDGFVLNEGAHAVYRSGILARTLDELGVAYSGGTPRSDTYRMVWDGEVVPLPTGPGSLATSRVLSARSKVKMAGWWSNPGRLADRAGECSVDEWLESQHAGADLRRLTLALMRLSSYSASPGTAAAAPLLRQLALSAGGVLYVDDGWRSLVGGLGTAALASGVSIVDHEPVIALEDVDGAWLVTTSARSVHAAAVVVASGGPAVAVSLLGDDPAGWAERAGPVQRAAVLDVGGRAATHGFLLSADEPLYLSTHAPVARLAPGDAHLVTAMRYVDETDSGDPSQSRADLERHAALAGAPVGEERMLERFLARPVVTWGSPVPGVTRPTGLELAHRGLLVAGDWIGDHLLADASASSGRLAGRAAAAHALVAA